MSNAGRTRTPVHDEASLAREKRIERLRADNGMLALGMGAQLLAMGALYLMPTAASASWWATLLLLAPATLLFALSCACAARMPARAARRPFYRAAAGVYALLFLSDMALCLLSLAELSSAFILPMAPRALLTFAPVLAVSLGVPGAQPGAAARVARALRLIIIGAFVFCGVTVLPQGETGYLFPLAGYGLAPSLRAALFLCGGVWSASLPPLLACRSEAAVHRRAHRYLPLLLVILLMTALFLCCIYVLPSSSLSGRWGFPLRLQALMKISPNTLVWSLMLLVEIFLFLTAFTASGAMACACLRRALGGRRVPLLLPALLSVPPALAGVDRAAPALIALLPWRYPLSVLLTLSCLLYNLLQEKKGTPS